MATGEETRYSLDQFEEERLYRDVTRPRTSRLYRRAAADVTHRLQELAPTSWLSIHRAANPRNIREERSYEFTVDQKLDQIGNSLVRFFSELEKQSTEEAEKFQETIFLSLIYEQTSDKLTHSAQALDVDKEKQALIQIFKKFNLPETRFLGKTNKYFKQFLHARNKFLDRSESSTDKFSIDDVLILLSIARIHSIIQEWNKFIKNQSIIFKPRDTFLKVLNDMLERKVLEINNRNEIFATTQSGKSLTPSELSSGEKQLLIILGEALLQKKAPWIYIADEPELSLHVKWQEVLIDNLRQMNPSSQIIVATHSPDIVSRYGDKVHNMESVLI